MALLSPQSVDITGLTPTYSAVNAADTVPRRDGLVLHVKNGDVAGTDVAIVVPGTKFGQANPDVVVTVAAGGDSFIHIPNDPSLLNTSGVIDVTYTNTTSVTAALLELSS